MPQREQRLGETEQDAAELYSTLEELFSDVFLLERGKLTLEEIRNGSSLRALHVLKRLQKYRLSQAMPRFMSHI